MKARLIGRTGELAGFELGFEGAAVIGRGADCDASLPLSSVSSRHAKIEWDEERGAFYLEDLGSRNGTWLDGLRVVARERLGRLSVVTLAEQHDLVFQDLTACEARSAAAGVTTETVALRKASPGSQSPSRGAAEAPGARTAPPPKPTPASASKPAASAAPGPGPAKASPQSTVVSPTPPPGPRPAATAPAPPEDAAATRIGTAPPPLAQPAPAAPVAPVSTTAPAPAAAPRISLEVEGEGGSRRISLREGENVVGRVPGAEIRLDSGAVSRRHAVLNVSGRSVRIRDEGSRNKSFLDGAELTPGDEVELRSGAALRFGTVKTRLVIE